MSERKSQIRPSVFATIEKSGSVSVKLNEFLGSAEGKEQLEKMKLVRGVAERLAGRSPVGEAGKK
jgi:hypothetical protein